jgi:hypothetical protein
MLLARAIDSLNACLVHVNLGVNFPAMCFLVNTDVVDELL